ncbi:MAG: M48 family metallopeptidase [Phycisphaerae bacterium]|nr:M48 family metallopeptidase [Phycisphaerae bacterium]
MSGIADRLARQIPDRPISLRCRLLACDKINAFSLPGGLIYVTKGLYARLSTEDRLAAVLAHELAHIVAKDSFKNPHATSQEKLAREVSADQRGVRYLISTGYRPEAMIDVIHVVRSYMPEGWAEVRSEAVVHEIERCSEQLAHAGADR